MSTYARIAAGVVAELFTPPAGVAISACFHPSLTWIECDGTPGVAPGWTYASGVFAAPPAPPAPTLAQQAATLLAGNLVVTSTGTPSLNGSYAIDATTQAHLQAEMLCVQVTGNFADGTATVVWTDASGANHTFPIAEFKAFAVAVAAFIAACIKVQNGTLTTLPTASATIA